MAIDYAALLGATAGIQVAKADYEHTRDGVSVGVPPINTQTIPDGALIVGVAILTTEAFTYLTDGYLQFYCGDKVLGAPYDALNGLSVAWGPGNTGVVNTRRMPIEALISDGNVLTGAATCWVFYLPT